MQRFLAGCIGSMTTLSMAATAIGDMSGISAEFVGEDLIEDAYTIRLYAELSDGDRLDAVFGNSNTSIDLQLSAGVSLYQHNFGGPTSTSVNSNLFPLVPSLQWDSYVTIGCLYTNGSPFGENNLQSVGINWASFESGGDLETNNGTWFVTPADAQGQELNGRVLIAQFTILGGDYVVDFQFSAGFQGKNADGSTWQSAHSFAIIPAPCSLILLGLPFLLRTRRRNHTHE